MAYVVLDCSSCGTPRVAESKNQTATCPRCGAQTRIEEARVHARTDSAKQARHALGQVNAQREGETLDQPAPERPESRDAIDEAIAGARQVAGQRRRVQVAAEGLTRELSTFTEDQWVQALSRLDIPRARALEHLDRLKRASLVTEPRHGAFEHVDP